MKNAWLIASVLSAITTGLLIYSYFSGSGRYQGEIGAVLPIVVVAICAVLFGLIGLEVFEVG